MLKDFLYFDEEAINKYGPQISEDFQVEYKTINTEVEKAMGVNWGIEKGLASSGLTYRNAKKKGLEGVIINSIITRYNKFESALKDNESTGLFLDFHKNNELNDLTSVGRSIVRVEGQFYIPKEFDDMELIEVNKESLMKHSPMDTEEENEFMNKWFINRENLLVPFKFMLDDNIEGFAKLNKENFIVDYDMISDYEKSDFIVLFKSNGYKKGSKDKVVFSIVKDYLSISRPMRRKFFTNEKIDDVEDIKMYGNYLDIEVLAIYKY